MTGEAGQDAAGKYRELQGVLRHTVELLLAGVTLVGCLWALDVPNLFDWVVYTPQYLALVLGLGLVACFLGVKATRGEAHGRGVPWYDWLAVAASIVTCGYVVVHYPVIVLHLGQLTTERWVLGGITVLLVFEATRRLVGWALVWLAVVCVLYTAYSGLLPGLLYSPSFEWHRILAYLYLDGNAILGVPLTVFSTILITFILFGRTLYALRGDRILTDAALAGMGRYRGGAAKVAVTGSSLFGTISGSVVSNVMTDGPITIPMMVRTGYPPHLAAAIEAVASNGGQILPPVMGLTAFLIADWLNIPYSEVVLAALLPALLYYVAVFAQVDLEAARRGLSGLAREALPRGRAVLPMLWVFALPFAALIYTLMVAHWHPGKAAMAAVAVALFAGLWQRATRPSLAALWHAVVGTGRTLLDLVAITAIAGVIIGALQLSGLAFNLSLVIVLLAGGSLVVLLLITAGLCIFLGMGLPSSVIYLILASLVAPALVEVGIPPIAAHMFLFYFGALSAITPPLCFATFAAATIAGCNFWRAGWAGVRLGFVAYVIPFIFVLQPELVMIGTPMEIALAFFTSAVGVILVSAGFVGYLFAPAATASRLLLVIAGLCLIPSPAAGPTIAAINVAGLLAAGAVIVPQLRQRARSRHSLS